MSAIPARAHGWRQRAMRLADLDAVVAIEVRAYSHPWTRGNFVDSLAAGYDAEVLEDDEGRVIAYLLALRGHEETHLLNLTVEPALQRRGIGRMLLDRLAARVRTRGDRTLWLEVRRSNAGARRLYRAAGMAEVGSRRDYYPALGNAREDAIVMRLALGGGDALD